MVLVHSRVVLPVTDFRERIVDSVIANEVTLISSETGSGKSTQIPQFLLQSRQRFKRQRESLNGFKICITQPRRVAAISLASRVSKEMGETSVGGTVGYRVRFDESYSDRTSMLFLTDGMLVREAVLDQGTFEKYTVVILDEVHERSLHTDLLLGLLSEAVKKRRTTSTPLKIVIMSATLTIESFKTFFIKAGISTNYISIPGRTFPVATWYTQSVEHDYVEASVCTILQICEDKGKKDGDILVFLPGQDDIEAVSSSLATRKDHVPGGRELVIAHLYAALSNDAQAAAFNPVPSGSHRKIILATNIAETSLTIPGVRFVIDCGLVKMKSMINSQLEVLRIVPASKATIIQRTGRAGREAPGECFRLYRESDFDKLVEQTPPEIVRSELCSSLLQISAMGLIGNKCLFASMSHFPFIDKPSDASVTRAELVLKRVGAIESTSKGITIYGKKLASFPLHPLLAHMILTSSEFSCVEEAIILASLLSVDNLWRSGKGSSKSRSNGNATGDHWYLVQLFKQMRDASSNEDRILISRNNGLNPTAYSKACKIMSQLEKIAVKQSVGNISSCGSPENFSKMITKSLWMNCAKLVKKSGSVGHYETIDKIECYIHPGSCLFGLKEPPECLVYTEIIQTSKNYIRAATGIEGHLLVELVPNYFKSRS
jgi:HrpA-like RNA helicase